MSTCHGCYKPYNFRDLNSNGYCCDCAKERQRIKDNLTTTPPARELPPKHPKPISQDEMRSKIVLTTETALDIPISKRLGIVSAEVIVGMNILKDLALEISDVVGGKSKIQQAAMSDLKEELFDQLRADALKLSANMIVGISLSFADYGYRRSAILATAIGTAVITQTES